MYFVIVNCIHLCIITVLQHVTVLLRYHGNIQHNQLHLKPCYYMAIAKYINTIRVS